MSKDAICKWKPVMWLMPLLIGLLMCIALIPAQVSADEHQSWITWGTPTATWTGNDASGADLYEADNAVAFEDFDTGSVVITYSVDGAQGYGHVHLQSATGGEVAGASVNEPNGTSRTATITGLAPETTYRLFWDATESNNKLQNDVYLTFTTEGEPAVTEPVQNWITFNAEEIEWREFSNNADWYRAKNKAAFDSDGNIVFSYSVDGAQNKGHVHIQSATGGEVEGASVNEPDGTSRTATIGGLSPNTTYRLFWAADESNGKLSNDVYLTFTTEGPNQTWITWGTPTATWNGKDENGADLYTADNVVAFEDFDTGSVVFTYSVASAQNYGHVHIQSATGGEVAGASVNEPNGLSRTATITGLAPETTYRLYWAATESNNRLQNDVYLTFTTEGEPTVTEPVQTWITFNAEEIEWREFSSNADWYRTKNKAAFDSDGNIIFSYSVDGAQKFGHVHLQSATGGDVEGASVNEPDGTSRIATIGGLSQNTTYRLFWAADESNGKLSNDVYLTFTTDGPSQTWITWGTPKATWTGSDESGADLYTADDAVEFKEDDSVVITYSVNGAQRYGHVHLQSATGGEVEDASVDEPNGTSRTATITGLAPETTYRLYWVASESNNKLQNDVYMIFSTGAFDPEALVVTGVKTQYEYTGSEIKPEYTVKVGNNILTEGTDYEVTYAGNRVNVGGTVTMTVTGKEGTAYEGKSKSKTFVITKAQITSGCIALPKGAGTAADGTVQYAYSGSEIKPAPVVTVNGRELVRGTDYVLSYTEDADFINVESGKVLTVNVVHANGSNYDGAGSVSYTIVPKSVTPIATLAKTTYTYSGKAIAPNETVKAGAEALVKGTDYTVSYTTTHKTVGKHGVKVTLKGNYKGTKTVDFKILPKAAVISKAKVGKKKVTVKLKTKVSATGGNTYQIAYKVKGTSKWKYTTTSKQSKTIKKLKKGKKYQFKVRAYRTVSKVKYYGAWSKIKTTKKVK